MNLRKLIKDKDTELIYTNLLNTIKSKNFWFKNRW